MLGLKKFLLIVISILFSTQIFAENEGYFNIQNGSEYLGFSNMSKEFGITSLMNSAMENDAKATKIFLNSGSYVNEKNIAKATPLHLASRNYAIDSAKVLIENGAEINAKDNEGWTPLMRASLNGDLEMIKLLVENNAKIWIKNNYGETAFLHTIMANCYECAEFLLNSTETKNSLVREQIRESLDVARKRYNEPLINLLEDELSKGGIMVLTTPNKDTPIEVKEKSEAEILSQEKITKIIYNFMGKRISKEEYEKLKANNFYKYNENEIKKTIDLKENTKTSKDQKNKTKNEKSIINKEIKPTVKEDKEVKEEIKPTIQQKNKKIYKFNSIKNEESVVENSNVSQEEIKNTEKKEEKQIIEEKKETTVKKSKNFNFTGKKINEIEELKNAETEKQKLDKKESIKKQEEQNIKNNDTVKKEEIKNIEEKESKIVIKEKPVIKEKELKQEEDKQKVFNFTGKKVSKTVKTTESKQQITDKQEKINIQQGNKKIYKLNSGDKKSIKLEETSNKNINKNILVNDEEVEEIQPKMKLINEGDKVNSKLIYNLKNPDEK